MLIGTGFAHQKPGRRGRIVRVALSSCVRIMLCKAVKEMIKDSDITGLKFFDNLAPLLKQLHDDGACVTGPATANYITINIAY